MKKGLILVALVGCLLGVLRIIMPTSDANPTTVFRTMAIQRGDLLSTVNATGTVAPEEVVNVGAQVAGLIVGFGEDPDSISKYVDFCSVVEKDAVLALIDPTFHAAAVEQAEAMLQSSEANLLQCEVKRDYAESEWGRIKELRKSNTVSESEYAKALADYESAKADIAACQAMIRQNTASLKTARINLGYCTIKSPVRGTIIERRVNVGQTVVASLNAPSLFLIAKDLTRMQVWASVNEADIGRIRLHMPVTFTVDAYEDEEFQGVVSQIRMNAQMTQNVVTYTVVITTDNSNGRLLPYLTANVNFEVDKKENVLLVPNVALRWTPLEKQLDPSIDKAHLAGDASLPQGSGRIWITDGNKGPEWVRPLEVTIGATDGVMTEISGKGVKEGLFVVIGEDELVTRSGGSVMEGGEASNPFLPTPPKGSSPPPGPMM